MSGKRKSLPRSNDFAVVRVTPTMITCLFRGLCVMPFCLFSLKRMRPWRFFMCYHFFVLGPEENERQGRLPLVAKSFLANKTAGAVRSVSPINQRWGTRGAEDWGSDV